MMAGHPATRLVRAPSQPPRLRFAARAEPNHGFAPNAPVIILTTAALAYNGLLAFLVARGLPVTMAIQVLAEALILTGAGLLILRSGFRRIDTPAIAFVIFFVAIDLFVSILNGVLIVDMARNAAIISLFVMLGARCTERAIRRTVFVAFLLVGLGLLLELVSVEAYASTFAPSVYFETTRGAAARESNELGLFPNALGFEGRFAILSFVTHRTSSIFLEQVSLANFSTALIVYVTCMWKRISWAEKIPYILLIALILVTNNSRTALALFLGAPIIYFAAPWFARYWTLAIMPVMLALATFIALTQPPSTEDNFVGRIGLTMGILADVDAAALIGAKATEAAEFLDSGYAYVLYESTILGLLIVWAFVSLIAGNATKPQSRAGIYVSLYIFANLMVSGTSIFSMKVAALLWLLVGFLRAQAPTENPEPISTEDKPLYVRPLRRRPFPG